jgi:uncharacterized surface protein with fasciclin (FAS1) repeats
MNNIASSSIFNVFKVLKVPKVPKVFKVLKALAAIALLAACDTWKDDIEVKNEGVNKNLYEVLSSEPDVSTFAQILQLTGYDQFLQEEQSLTVFAPKNDALSGLNLSDAEQLKEWVKNYIAYLTYFTDQSGKFEVSSIRMLNNKNVPVNTSSVSGATISKPNGLASNGVLHVIDALITDRKNVWEYLQEQTGYAQVECIQSFDERVMDTIRSVQTGIVNGRPVYDTIWTTQNKFLRDFPLGDETQSFTFVLLEQNALNMLKTKYAKYFVRKAPEEQEVTVIRQITLDMLLLPVSIDAAGRYESFNDVLVDINPADIREMYQASNGKVYKLNAADVKIYNNKIKEQIIEAEDFAERWDGQDAWSTRYRTWASNGQDVILKGQTQNTFEYDIYDEEVDSIVHKSETKTFQMHYRTASERFISKSNNAYLKYHVPVHSIPYQIRWVTYDDNADHHYDVNDTIKFQMTLEQKLLVSFPDEPEVERLSDGKIQNNFSAYSVMAGASTAGVHEETLLSRYRINTTTGVSTTGLYVLDQPFPSEDDFGQGSTLKCPYAGQATFFVANTVRKTDTYAGVMFLDYIRLTPLVDPDE